MNHIECQLDKLASLVDIQINVKMVKLQKCDKLSKKSSHYFRNVTYLVLFRINWWSSHVTILLTGPFIGWRILKKNIMCLIFDVLFHIWMNMKIDWLRNGLILQVKTTVSKNFDGSTVSMNRNFRRINDKTSNSYPNDRYEFTV